MFDRQINGAGSRDESDKPKKECHGHQGQTQSEAIKEEVFIFDRFNVTFTLTGFETLGAQMLCSHVQITKITNESPATITDGRGRGGGVIKAGAGVDQPGIGLGLHRCHLGTGWIKVQLVRLAANRTPG